MKIRSNAIALGLVLGLATGTSGYAMSRLASISLTPLSPTNSQPGNVVLYEVTVERSGQGLLEVQFSSDCLPAGATASFAYNPLRFTGRDPRFMHFIMAVTCEPPTPTNVCTFIVTGKARRETLTSTNNLVFRPLTTNTAPVLVALNILPGGDVDLHGLGQTGQTYQIEATTDLASPTWTSVGSSTADGDGRFTFIHADAQAHVSAMRFYRAVRIP